VRLVRDALEARRYYALTPAFRIDETAKGAAWRSMKDSNPKAGENWREIVGTFLKLGATAYGGPAVMGIMRPSYRRGADQGLAEREHIIPDDLVLDVVASSALTAYDAEFVALALALSVPLVTADQGVLKAFPDAR